MGKMNRVAVVNRTSALNHEVQIPCLKAVFRQLTYILGNACVTLEIT
jgi:hypothetical protein